MLNRRPGVRPITVERVLQAASALKYVPAAGLDWAAPTAPLRLSFLLPAGTNRYLSMLGRLAGRSPWRSALRQLVVATLAAAVTFGVGRLVGVGTSG